jgi:CheY-like chemotaxis protein
LGEGGAAHGGSRAIRPIELAIAGVLAGVLVLDVVSSLGVAVWVFYLVPVGLTLLGARAAAPLVVAGVATLGIAVGYFLSPPMLAGLDPAFPPINRAMGIGVLWAVALVARQTVIARSRLAADDWLRTGQRDLGTLLQGEKDAPALGGDVVRFLAERLGARVGAIYLDEGAGALRCIGRYALDASEARARDEVALGEGLLGEAVKAGTLLRVHDVPQGYLMVSSSLGAASPRELVILPARADGVVVGALELAFFHPLGPLDVELLTSLAEPIGIALRSVRLRRELERLLAETQAQAEELQQQGDALRAVNEELEQQADALRQAQAALEENQAALEEGNAQLAAQTRALEEQRDELVQTQAALFARSDELARTSRYKSEFLANMSHELRTPLTSTLILAKILKDNETGHLSPKEVEYAATIYAAGQDLLALINDILDLSRVEAGALDVSPEPVELGGILQALERTFAPMAVEKGLTLTLTADPSAPPVLTTDGLRLQQILRNLLSNALKFTERGEVSLRVRAAEDAQVSFEVTDTGPGIAPAHHELVFEAFRQADGTTQRKHGGTGLGLTISRELAYRLGGRLELASALGEGSTFTLVLPTVLEPPRRASTPPPALPATPPPSAPIEPVVVDDDRESLGDAAPSVLVIEDDVAFARLLRDLARKAGFRAVVATTAATGLALAQSLRPSAILLDLRLPDGSGLSVLERLKRTPATRHVPVHVVSVSEAMPQALSLGAVGYALKPLERDRLTAMFRGLHERLARKARRVLVVEDQPAQREALVALLGRERVEVDSVADVEGAVERLRTAQYDCVVLDLTLDGRSGFELLERMAGGQAYSFPPVVVYTGRVLERADEERLRRYASSVIVKGARSPERLLDEVTLFLHQADAELPPSAQQMLRVARRRDTRLEGRTVLVVEDDVRNVFAVTNALESAGLKVRVARNGREALATLAGESGAGVDMVLMDLMMPEMDGLSAIRAIRAEPRWAALPILALTAKAMPDDREACLAAGANDYLAKPLDIDKLLSLVKVWMPR